MKRHQNKVLTDYPEMKGYIDRYNRDMLMAQRRLLFGNAMDKLMQSTNKEERKDIIEIYRHDISFIDKEINAQK